MLHACCMLLAMLVAVAGIAEADSHSSMTRDIETNGLSGTLTLPEGSGPFPVALILAGSGPVDRDGNLPGARNDSLKLLAEGLAMHGIGSLRIDKRGIGRSGGAATREENLRFATYVDDAVAWLAKLRGEPNVGTLFLLGHSEGALVATLTAQRSPVAGLILLAGAGEPAPAVIARQLADAGASEALQATSRRIAQSLADGTPVENVPAELGALYRPSVQPYLISWFSLDPALELAKIRGPILIIQGTTDLQISPADARKLAAAAPDAGLTIIEGMNHVLKDAPLERSANLATYARQDALSKSLLPAIVRFVRSNSL